MIEYQSTPDFYNEYISHHGVLNQKWGVKNGPPYPLSREVSTGSRLKSGAKGQGSIKKKSSKGTGKVYKNRPDNLSEVNLNKKSKSNKLEDQDLLSEENLDKNKERSKAAADLGLKALNKNGHLWNDFDEKNIDDSDRDWFLIEDQTIGLATIADLVRQGKTKKEIKDLLDQVDKINPYDESSPNGAFELNYNAGPTASKNIDKFIDACIDINKSEGKKGAGWREIRTSERITDQDERDRKEREFIDFTKRLKVEHEMSVEELNRAVLEEMNRVAEEARNGNIDISRRIGSSGKNPSVPDNKLTNFVDSLFNKANSIDYKKEASNLADKAKPYADKAKDGIDKAFDKANEMFPPKDKKPTLTTAQMIDNASKKGLEEHAKRKQNAINDNQDMFNDMLYNNRYGNNKKEDTKAYQKEIARVAKEYGITKQALQKEVEANFNQREKEIANKKYWESLKPDSKAQMNKMLNEAKKTDRYPIYFLEVTQNAPWVESHIEGKISDSAYKNKMFQEYKKYLEDPEKYVKSV